MKKIIITLLIFVIIISVILVSNIKTSLTNNVPVPQFQPILYKAGKTSYSFNCNNQQINAENCWDFTYYIAYKSNNTYYKVEKTKNANPLMDSSFNVTEAYQWFLGTTFINTKNQSIRNYNLVFPNAFTPQPTEFYDTDSVLVCSADSGILFLIHKEAIPTNAAINEKNIKEIPSNKIKKMDCIANHELYIPLNNLSEGSYTLFLEKNKEYSAINTSYIEVKVTEQPQQTLENNTDTLPNIKNVELKLYPNPATTYINVEFNTNESMVNVEILNVDGALILKNKSAIYDNKLKLSIQNLANGMYYIKIQDNKQIGNAKFYKY